jgi:hypothetical protein
MTSKETILLQIQGRVFLFLAPSDSTHGLTNPKRGGRLAPGASTCSRTTGLADNEDRLTWRHTTGEMPYQ